MTMKTRLLKVKRNLHLSFQWYECHSKAEKRVGKEFYSVNVCRLFSRLLLSELYFPIWRFIVSFWSQRSNPSFILGSSQSGPCLSNTTQIITDRHWLVRWLMQMCCMITGTWWMDLFHRLTCESGRSFRVGVAKEQKGWDPWDEKGHQYVYKRNVNALKKQSMDIESHSWDLSWLVCSIESWSIF